MCLGCRLDAPPEWGAMAINGMIFVAYATPLVLRSGADWRAAVAVVLTGVSFPLWFYSLVLHLAGPGARGWPMPSAYASAALWSTVSVAALLARATGRPIPIVLGAAAAAFGAGCLAELLNPAAWHVGIALGLCFAGPRRVRLPVEDGRCTACGYSVEGLPDSVERCPECGTVIRAEPLTPQATA